MQNRKVMLSSSQ